MDLIDKLPDTVKKGIVKFLEEIPVEKYSEEWRSVQAAITMIIAPNSFKEKAHVFLTSHDSAREEGYYDIHEMSIRIWPHKVQLSRFHEIWSSWNGTELHELYRYTFPGGKHSVYEFENLLSNTAGLFSEKYCLDDSSMAQHASSSANYKIKTNIK